MAGSACRAASGAARGSDPWEWVDAEVVASIGMMVDADGEADWEPDRRAVQPACTLAGGTAGMAGIRPDMSQAVIGPACRTVAVVFLTR